MELLGYSGFAFHTRSASELGLVRRTLGQCSLVTESVKALTCTIQFVGTAGLQFWLYQFWLYQWIKTYSLMTTDVSHPLKVDIHCVVLLLNKVLKF